MELSLDFAKTSVYTAKNREGFTCMACSLLMGAPKALRFCA